MARFNRYDLKRTRELGASPVERRDAYFEAFDTRVNIISAFAHDLIEAGTEATTEQLQTAIDSVNESLQSAFPADVIEKAERIHTISAELSALENAEEQPGYYESDQKDLDVERVDELLEQRDALLADNTVRFAISLRDQAELVQSFSTQIADVPATPEAVATFAQQAHNMNLDASDIQAVRKLPYCFVIYSDTYSGDSYGLYEPTVPFIFVHTAGPHPESTERHELTHLLWQRLNHIHGNDAAFTNRNLVAFYHSLYGRTRSVYQEAFDMTDEEIEQSPDSSRLRFMKDQALSEKARVENLFNELGAARIVDSLYPEIVAILHQDPPFTFTVNLADIFSRRTTNPFETASSDFATSAIEYRQIMNALYRIGIDTADTRPDVSKRAKQLYMRTEDLTEAAAFNMKMLCVSASYIGPQALREAQGALLLTPPSQQKRAIEYMQRKYGVEFEAARALYLIAEPHF